MRGSRIREDNGDNNKAKENEKEDWEKEREGIRELLLFLMVGRGLVVGVTRRGPSPPKLWMGGPGQLQLATGMVAKNLEGICPLGSMDGAGDRTNWHCTCRRWELEEQTTKRNCDYCKIQFISST